ncbi:metallophosphoesterase [Aliiglaciecola lipolytica]|uniref:Ser/Thr protein phosphatase family protein n=1 Tax=Aliiglaciecola lipolytica E3 TaxID=1127673 RepID=K6XQH2_9ALTE|nr:metallophosphoesterase [Aliiglaciecola lipolytica]GAC13931.1 Ser/Thr protein phosphatase family protein [Aliiglaciecola lipolytica E3]
MKNRTNKLLPVFACLAFFGNAHAENSSAEKVINISIFGDHGVIPFYNVLDDDDQPIRTMADYMADQVEGHLEKNHTMEGFSPTPAMFEPAQGSWVPASGMYPVAWAQKEHCQTRGCDFALMLGDNIYPDGATLGADGVTDARRFKEMLHQPYGNFGAGTPNFTIYSMLGNHDWRVSREAAVAQMEYLQQHPNFYMPDLFYKVSPPGFEGEVEIFVIDTEMLLASGVVKEEKVDVDGNELDSGHYETWPDHIKLKTPEEKRMLEWLETSLKNSKARWKIVAGHHALWSGGGSKFEKARTLRKLFMPTLCRYADAYFNGDDHTLEAWTDDCVGVTDALSPPLPLMTSGAAGKQRNIHPALIKKQQQNYPGVTSLFSKGQAFGFIHAQIKGEELRVQILTTPNDLSGRPIVEAEFTFPRRTTN